MRYLPLLLILAACGDSSGPPALQPASFAVVEGAAQVDTVGRELKDAIALRVVATDGATAVPNVPITWTPLDDGGVFAAVVLSGSDGIARNRYTLGTRAGTQRVRLTAIDGETGAVLVDDTVTATATPKVAVSFTLTNADLGNPGDSAGVAILYRDEYANVGAPCPGGTDWQEITWASDDSAVAVPTGRYFTTDPTPDTPMGGRYVWVYALKTGTASISGHAVCLGETATLAVSVR